MKRMPPAYWCGLTLLLTGLLFAGCGNPPDTRQTDPVEYSAALPTLPLDRQAAGLLPMFQEGQDYFSRSANASVDDAALNLLSSPGVISWGIWQFNVGDDELVDIDITLVASPGDEVFVAVADYAEGNWELSGPFSSSVEVGLNNTDHRSAAGNAYVGVVTAGSNPVAVESLELHTSRTGWQNVTMATGLEHAYGLSIAEIAGRPGVSYLGYDASRMIAYELMYAYCTTPGGAQPDDWGTVRADPAAVTSYGTSLAEVEGSPAITYTFKPETNQWFVAYTRSTTALGDQPGDWSSRILVDESNDQAWNPTLVVADGSPAIFYNDFGESDLEYAWSTNTRGTDPLAWQEQVTVDEAGAVGRIPSAIILFAGLPAVAYYDSDNQAIKYSHSESENGVGAEDWLGNDEIVETLTTVAFDPYFSFALISDKPGFCVYDEAAGNLRYRRAMNFLGGPETVWDDAVVIDTDGEWGKYCSLADIQGHPAISFFDSSGQLKYVRSSSFDGRFESSWSNVQTVEAGTFDAIALAEVDGKPAIVYYDESNHVLKYAILFE